jgi:hypothetical protein
VAEFGKVLADYEGSSFPNLFKRININLKT